MSEFTTQHTNHSPGQQPDTRSGGAPGKRTLTAGIPPKKRDQPEIEMTGIAALDNDKSRDGGARFTLDEYQRLELRRIVQGGILVWLAAVMAALQNTKLTKATKTEHFWNGFLEILFLSVTGPFIGPIAGALARNLSKMAVPLAEIGMTKAAWAMAMSPSDLVGPVTIAFKGVRGQMAHHDGRPKDLDAQMAFLSALQASMGPAAMKMIEEISQFDGDDQLVAYYWALKDPDVMDVGAHEARILKLLDMFDNNRLGYIGKEMDFHGGLKTAEPKRIRWRNMQFMVLLESLGVSNSALALNGMNMDKSKPKMTIESLIYVRMIEKPMWAMVTREYAAEMETHGLFVKPSTEIEELNFNDPSVRAQHRWATDFHQDYKARKGKTDDVANQVGDDDPFDFNYGLTEMSS